jgi:hypothetical protein
MAAHLEFANRNEAYIATFNKGDLALPPAKKYIIGTLPSSLTSIALTE